MMTLLWPHNETAFLVLFGGIDRQASPLPP